MFTLQKLKRVNKYNKTRKIAVEMDATRAHKHKQKHIANTYTRAYIYADNHIYVCGICA